jgi:hypothetical protein
VNLDVNINIIQYIAIIGSTIFIFFILELIRKKTLHEAYSLLWLFFALVFLGLSVWRQGLDVISGLIGISYPPAALFLTLLIAMFLILIQFSIVISKLSENNKKLAQEVGLLKNEIETLKPKKKK